MYANIDSLNFSALLDNLQFTLYLFFFTLNHTLHSNSMWYFQEILITEFLRISFNPFTKSHTMLRLLCSFPGKGFSFATGLERYFDEKQRALKTQ